MQGVHWRALSTGLRALLVTGLAAAAALLGLLPAGHGAAWRPAAGQRASNAEVMIVTRGSLEASVQPSG